MMNIANEVKYIIDSLSAIDDVCAIAVGGSRACGNDDAMSDYDMYVYYNEKIDPDKRKAILEPLCSRLEIENDYWETEDNCILKIGTKVDIIYRELKRMEPFVEFMLSGKKSFNGYSTCFLHNIRTAQIFFDRNGILTDLQKKCAEPLPENVCDTIIRRNMHLVSEGIDSFRVQVEKAVKRNDLVSINHRITGFVETYFDVIFALNRLTHPGEKRLISLCKKNCALLPDNFEENLTKMFRDMYGNTELLASDLDDIIRELKKLLENNGYLQSGDKA